MGNEKQNTETSLKDLEERARAFASKKDKLKNEVAPTEIVKVEEAPILEKNPGGRPANPLTKDDLTDKDIQIMALLACGIDKTVVANIAGIDRRQLYRLLDSGRIQRFTEGAKKRLASLAPLAVEIVHSELVKGNIEVAQSVLKGLNIMRASVNQKGSIEKEKTTAEEIIDQKGTTTRRVVKEREITDD